MEISSSTLHKIQLERRLYQCRCSHWFRLILTPLLLLLITGQPSWSQGFPATATQWGLPTEGGYNLVSSYNTLMRTADTRAEGQGWAVRDMNGDNRPDLVVLTEDNGTYNEPFGTGTARYWKVYFNTGTGYATTAQTWALPPGGYIASGTGHLFSFNALEHSSTPYTGNQSWVMRDMNGDSRPDLVVLTEGTGIYDDVFGTGTNRYWKVYLNTGTGFSMTVTTWALPPGGYISNGHTYSFNSLNHEDGTQRWSVIDINGDARVDLVVLTENSTVFGDNTNTGRYWKVYLNTGAGFSTAATNWELPAGGHIFITGGVGGGRTIFLSFDYLAYSRTTYIGDLTWAVQDMNGDSRPDLVVLTERTNTYEEPFGTSNTGRYWKVYINTGTGFSTAATTWPLPAGGYIDYNNGHAYSFNALESEGSSLTGNQRWVTRDINGDAQPDLVILAEGNGTSIEPFGMGAGRYWKIFLNTATGFAATTTTWSLPTGGYSNFGRSYSFGSLDYVDNSSSLNTGNQSWSVLDMNGDFRPDLVVLAERSNYYSSAFGTGATGRYWKVYLNSSAVTAATNRSISTYASLYPNPATDQVVMTNAPASVGQSYAVTDCLGRMLLRGKITAPTQQLDLTSLANGLYIIQVGDQSKHSLRLIKQ